MLKSNRMFSAILTMGVLSFPVSGLAMKTQDDPMSEIQKINLQFVHFQKALSSKDAVSVGELYLEEAVSLLQNQPSRKGREAIEARWKQAFSGSFSFGLTSLEISLSSSGQEAYQYGTFEIHSTDATASLLASGKWLFIWRKELDSWRIALEMDNFNSPK